MNFLRSRNAQNGEEKHSVSNTTKVNSNFALATFPWYKKTAKERYKGVATKFSKNIIDSKNKNKQQNKKHGLSPKKCFSLMHQVLSRSEKPKP